jgi:autotransporter-associated beta strand protein
LDLRGFNLTVASLRTDLASGQTANGITNTTGGTTSVLTLNNTQGTSNSYASQIGVPANTTNLSGASNNIALVLASTNTGTQILTGTTTYAGSTTINGGTLRLSGSGSINSSSAITVGTGGTLLQTSSTRITPTVTSSGTLSGVNGTAGQDQLYTGVIANSGSRLAVEISGTISSVTSDKLAASGTLDLLPSGTGTMTIDLTGVGGFTPTDFTNSQEFQVASAGTLKINGNTITGSTNVTSSFVVTSSSFTVFSYSVRADATGLFVIFATPEPATVLLICAGAAGLVHTLRRRRKETTELTAAV